MKKILVVEDNRFNRRLLEDILEGRGYRVIIAENGEEGIKKAKAEQPHLILMDIQIPRMDGYEAARLIKKDTTTSAIKIIAVTSLAMKGDREKIMAAGFDGYMVKPLDTRELARLVDRMLA
jgi:CheY-like chemotaxis protein